MSKPRFSGLGGVMRGQAELPAALVRHADSAPGEMPDDEDENEECEAGDGSKEKEPKMKDKDTPETTALVQASTTSGNGVDAAAIRAEERNRIAAVFASDDVKGRELAAAHMLAESDMSADAIVAMLPKLTPAASADEGGQMLAAMSEGADTNLGQGGEAPIEANHGWDAIHAEIRDRRA